MDKKLKNAADKIRMPEDMKQRIISAAELAEKNHVNTDNDGYIEVVSSAERVDSRRGIIRTISAIAACAVLVGGIGTTGFLLHRHNSTQMSGSEVSGTECRSCPFGDFSEFDYRFDAGDGKYGRYSAETYTKLSDFLNKFNWGEELTEYETRTEEQDAKVYHIKWTRGDTPPVDCDIYISVDGFVTYQESMMSFESGAMETIGSKCYKIDFDAFNSGVQEILAQADAPTPFGDFSEFEYSLDAQDGKFGEYSAETYAKLSDFLNKFNWGVELGMSEAENDDETGLHDLFYEKYTITWTKGDTPPVNCNIYVSKTGYVLYNEDIEYLETDEDHFIECRSYRIDFNAFDSGIQAIIAEDANNVSPFGDFSKLDYILNANDAKYSELSDDVRANLSDFLNNFNWGEEISDDQLSEEEKNRSQMNLHSLEWRSEDKLYGLAVMEIGYAVYNVQKVTYVKGYGEVIEPESVQLYRVDYEAFDKGITEILAKYKAEAPTEVFERAKLYYATADGLTPISDEGVIGLDDFLLNDFKEMLQPTRSDDIVGGLVYGVDLVFKLDDNKMRTVDYFIYTDGFVECNECETDENGEMQLTNTEKYKIDVDKLESVLKDEIGVELPEYREININKVD